MGKDKFGTKRGKCALCEECKEYTKPSNDSQNCDYCDHKPVYHIEVIKLGACSCNSCSGYTSSECVYIECEYCECPAHNHEGWDKIQKEVEKIKYRIAKPTGAIGSVATTDIHSSPQPNPIIAQGVPPMVAPLPTVQVAGGLHGYASTQSQDPKMGGTVPHGARYEGQAQYSTQQPQPNPAGQYPYSSQGATHGYQPSPQQLQQQPTPQFQQQQQPPTPQFQQQQQQPTPQFQQQQQQPPTPQFQQQQPPTPQFQQQPSYTPMTQAMPPRGYQQSGMSAQSYQQQPGHMNPQSMPQRPPTSASSGQTGGYGAYFGSGGGGSVADKCKNPSCPRNKRPKEDGSGFYDFCGRTCAKQCS